MQYNNYAHNLWGNFSVSVLFVGQRFFNNYTWRYLLTIKARRAKRQFCYSLTRNSDLYDLHRKAIIVQLAFNVCLLEVSYWCERQQQQQKSNFLSRTHVLSDCAIFENFLNVCQSANNQRLNSLTIIQSWFCFTDETNAPLMLPATPPQRRILWWGSQRVCAVGISNEQTGHRVDCSEVRVWSVRPLPQGSRSADSQLGGTAVNYSYLINSDSDKTRRAPVSKKPTDFWDRLQQEIKIHQYQYSKILPC